MTFLAHSPHPALRAAVRTYWTLEGQASGESLEHILPDGHGELVIHLGNPFLHHGTPQPRALWIGQMRSYIHLQPRGRISAFGVTFTPHGAACFAPFPQHEALDRVLPLADLFPQDPWLDRLAHAPSLPARIAAADQLLLARFRNPPDPRLTAALNYLHLPGSSIDLLATYSGLSRRQLERRFLSTTGLTPKTLHRIFRFQRTLRLRAASPHAPWAALAADAGYYDQSHLIADFRQFAGAPPLGLERSLSDLGRAFIR